MFFSKLQMTYGSLHPQNYIRTFSENLDNNQFINNTPCKVIQKCLLSRSLYCFLAYDGRYNEIPITIRHNTIII